MDFEITLIIVQFSLSDFVICYLAFVEGYTSAVHSVYDLFMAFLSQGLWYQLSND